MLRDLAIAPYRDGLACLTNEGSALLFRAVGEESRGAHIIFSSSLSSLFKHIIYLRFCTALHYSQGAGLLSTFYFCVSVLRILLLQYCFDQWPKRQHVIIYTYEKDSTMDG